MRVRVLGCMGAYPVRNSACNGYLVSCGGKRFLIDCGPGTLAKLIDGDYLKDLDFILLSHLHFDHMSDILPMQYALSFAQKKIDVYIPATPSVIFDTVRQCSCLNLNVLDGRGFFMDGIEFGFFRTEHPCECYAVKIVEGGKTLVYTADCKYSDGLAKFCMGADLTLADAAQSNEGFSIAVPHMSVQQGKELKEKAGLIRMLVTHFSPLKDTRAEIAAAGLEYAEEDKEYIL